MSLHAMQTHAEAVDPERRLQISKSSLTQFFIRKGLPACSNYRYRMQCCGT